MRRELVDACSCLEAENIDVKVLSGKRKTVLTRKLAGDGNAVLANEERLLLHCLVRLQTHFVHFDEAIIRRSHEFQSLFGGR